jgi:hypothetical protein
VSPETIHQCHRVTIESIDDPDVLDDGQVRAGDRMAAILLVVLVLVGVGTWLLGG